MSPFVIRAILIGALLSPAVAAAQYAEVPRPLPGAGTSILGSVFQGAIRGAAQIGRRLFLGGRFSVLSDPTGSAIVVDPTGTLVPGAFPPVVGDVNQAVSDGFGGWFLAGAFTSVGGRAAAGFARVSAQRALDSRFIISVDGPVQAVAVGHGRVYLAGAFTRVNAVPREGLAALSLATGQVEAWAAGFGTGGRPVAGVSISSSGVYVLARPYAELPGRVWGFDAATGRQRFGRTVLASTIAASSARVYLGAYGYTRPVWAIDPLTGDETPWLPNLTFQYQSGSYGDYTSITSMLLDGGRLYFAGRFSTTDGRSNLAAVDVASGDGVAWRPSGAGWYGLGLTRIGPAIVQIEQGVAPKAYDVTTAAVYTTFHPAVFGAVFAVAPAPEGALLVGSFTGAGGVPRPGLAAIDVDTYVIEPWTPALPMPNGFASVEQVETDGTWLFVRTSDSRVAKIDPVTGAVAAIRTFASPNAAITRMVVSGGEVFVTSHDQAAELGALAISDWSYRVLPVTLTTSYGAAAYVTTLAAAGNSLYLGGNFATANGQNRPFVAAVDRQTGAVLPWRPAPNAEVATMVAADGSVWAGGRFRRIGGERRRGLAALDPATGAARAFNPDVIGLVQSDFISSFNLVTTVAASGTTLYAAIGSSFVVPSTTDRPTVGGQRTGYIAAFSMTTGARLPWRPQTPALVALTLDCLLTSLGCLPPGEPPATNVSATTAGAAVTLSWTLPSSSTRTGVRLEAGSREGRADLLSIDLPPGQTTFAAVAPPGSFVARVRTIAGVATSAPSPDVSFAVGAPFAAAPLDATATTNDTVVTFAWAPPTTGPPAAYEVELGLAEGRRDAVIGASGAATSVVFPGPPAKYWARVVSLSPTGRSAPGQELLIDTTYPQGCGFTPAAPAGLAATVSGRVVTFTWQPSVEGAQTDPLQLVAGSASGASDLATLSLGASATSFVVSAPAGTYYVRVQATNLCGSVAASNEVRVDVP